MAPLEGQCAVEEELWHEHTDTVQSSSEDGE